MRAARPGRPRPSRLRHRPLLRVRRGTSTRSTPISPRAGVRFRSDGPVEMTDGPERGRQEPLLARPRRVRDRVPRAAAPCRRLTRPTRGRAARRAATARRAVPADAPDPGLRGARRGALRAGRDLRHRPQLRRPGGDRRRRRGRDARDGLPRGPPPLARAPDRSRGRPAPDDGRDVRQADGLLQGARRLDAHRRPLARHPGLQRHRRRRAPSRLRCRADGDGCAAPARRPWPSSATAPPARAPPTRR